MGFAAFIAAAAPIIKKIGSVVCQVASYGLGKLGDALSGNSSVKDDFGGTQFHESKYRLNDITDIEIEKQEKTISAVSDFCSLGLPLDTSQKLTERIYQCCDQAKTITQTAITQIEQITTTMNFTLTNKDANYIPVTGYTFKKEIIESLSKYDYVLPLFLITEIKNVTDNTGIRLDVAISTAYESTWTKIDPEKLMKNLNPTTIDNKQSITDVQVLSFEEYNTYDVSELQEKYPWLKVDENLDLLYKGQFDDKIEFNEKTTRNPKNGIVLKNGIRKDTQWIPYPVFRYKLNAMGRKDDFSDSCQLFTGYCIKPRLEDDSNENEICKVSLTINMVVLGLQNGADISGNMLKYPSGVSIQVPGKNGIETYATPEQVQEYAAKSYLTQYNAKEYPSTLIKNETLNIYQAWYDEANNSENDKIIKDKYQHLLKMGVCFHGTNNKDCGFTIRE